MFERFIDNLLQKIDKQEIIRFFNDGASAKEIANEMNISQDWVDEVIGEYEAKFDKVDDWAEEHGATLQPDGSWSV